MTPVATTSAPNSRDPVKVSESAQVLTNNVPIIAPPEGYVGKFPQSAETLAKMRLKRYLEREASGRQTDGLPPGICLRPPLWMVKAAIDEGIPLVHDENMWVDDVVVEWEVVLGVGRKRRQAAIKWLLDVCLHHSLLFHYLILKLTGFAYKSTWTFFKPRKPNLAIELVS